MTTPATGRSLISACNGVTRTFNCPAFISDGDLAVYLLDSATDPNSAGMLLSEGADYSIGGGDSHAALATITTTIAQPDGKFIRRWRTTSRKQEVEITPNQGLPAATQEGVFDRLSLIDEEHDDDIARCFILPPGETIGAIPAKAARAGMYLAFDVAGGFIASSGSGADAGLRTDLAAPTGASLVAFDPAQNYAAGSVGAVLKSLFAPLLSSPNYVGIDTDDTFRIAQGTLATPSITEGATLVVEKVANVAAFNAMAVMAFKKSGNPFARGTALYAEATDEVGGFQSFIEGIRTQSTLQVGASGSAYGGILVAGTAPAAGGPTSPGYLIACEAEVDNQIGPDAPTFATFDKNNYKSTFVATNGNGGGIRFKADAAFVTNPFSMTPFRTGILFAENSIDDTGIAYRAGLTIVCGIDMSLATVTGAAIKIPNNVKVTGRNAANSADLDIVRLDNANVVQLGFGATGVKLNGTVSAPLFANAANDADALTAGIAVGQFYRNGSVLMQRAA